MPNFLLVSATFETRDATKRTTKRNLNFTRRQNSIILCSHTAPSQRRQGREQGELYREATPPNFKNNLQHE